MSILLPPGELNPILPFRPLPEPGESLLSWTLRLAVENGVGLDQFIPELLRRSRPHPERGVIPRLPARHLDLTGDEALLGTLAAAAQVPVEMVRALTAAVHQRNVPPVFLLLSLPQRLQTEASLSRHRQGQFRQAYCPECLAESFHLRRVWNLAFACVCPAHRRQLLDACPRCRGDLDFTAPEHHRWRWEQPPGVLPCQHCRFDLRRAKRHPAGLPIDQGFMEFLNCLLILAETPFHTPRAKIARRRQTLDAVGVQLTLIRIPGYRYNRGAGMRPYYEERRRLFHQQAVMDALGVQKLDPAWSKMAYRRLPCEARYVLLRMAAWLVLNRRERESLVEDYRDGTWHGLMLGEVRRLKALGRLVDRRTAARHAETGDAERW